MIYSLIQLNTISTSTVKDTCISKFATFYLRLISAVTLGIAVAIFIAPRFVIELFFNNASSDGVFFMLFLGSTLIGYSLLNGTTSTTPESIQRKVATANLATLLIATLLSVWGALTVIDKNAWLLIAQHGLFASGFLAILVYKKAPTNRG